MDILGRGKCLPTGGDRYGEFINALIDVDKLFVSLHCFCRESWQGNFH